MATATVDLSGNKKRLRKESAVRAAFFAAALFSILVTALVVFSLIREAWAFMSTVEWKTVWSDGWFPRRGSYDIKTLLAGSFIVTGVAMVVAVPVGLGAAVYLSEYARGGSGAS